jgi:hypothetical protein
MKYFHILYYTMSCPKTTDPIADKILSLYPGRIPIIVRTKNKNLELNGKNKFLVPEDITVGQFLYIIRKRLKILPEQAMFFICNNRMLSTSCPIISTYVQHKDENGFLTFYYDIENTFGN